MGLTQNENINTLYKRNSSTNLVLRSTVEPFNKFRIELTANRNNSMNQQEYYRWSSEENMFSFFSEIKQGQYSISFIFENSFTRDNDNLNLLSFRSLKL